MWRISSVAISNAAFRRLLNGGLKLRKLTDKFLSGGMIIQYGGGLEKKGEAESLPGPRRAPPNILFNYF